MSKAKKQRPLPTISADHLLRAPFDGTEAELPYSTARTFAARGYGEILGTVESRDWRSHPDARFRYNILGVQTSAKLYRSRLSPEDRLRFDRSYNETAQGIGDLLEGTPLETLIKASQDLVLGLEERGHDAISSRAHLWALVEHQAALAVKP